MGVIKLDCAEINSHALFTGSSNASDMVVSFLQSSGDRLIAVSGAGNDSITLGLGNDTVVGKGSATLHGGGNFSFTGGSGGTDRAIVGSGNATLLGGGRKYFFTAGGAGLGTMDAAGAKTAVFLFNATSHGGTHVPQHFDSAHDKLHLLGYDTAQAPASAQVAGGSTALDLGDGTTIKLQNFIRHNAKDFG